jgi:hypothetical protein
MVDLRTVYSDDGDAVFLLTGCELPKDAPMGVRGLQRLARTLSVLMRDGFSIENAAQQQYAKGRLGGILALDDGAADADFIRDLYTGSGYANKMESQRRSKECLDFFLEEHAWDATIRDTRMLRVAPDDAGAILGGLPRYQYDSLLDCAREVVRAPTAVYRGLRNEGALKAGGLAFCGVPSRRRMNGRVEAAPEGYVFVVFASPEGYVFDWDWVEAAPNQPGVPMDADKRFGQPQTNVHGELLLGGLRQAPPQPFRPRHAWFSRHGDCVFWYLSDTETYAHRYDEYLTAFFSAEADRCVGFKLKVVSRLFDTIRNWAEGPNEGILVTVDTEADPVKVELSFLMKAWAAASLPTSKELFPGMELMKQLGDEGLQAITATPVVEIPKKALEELRALQRTA